MNTNEWLHLFIYFDAAYTVGVGGEENSTIKHTKPIQLSTRLAKSNSLGAHGHTNTHTRLYQSVDVAYVKRKSPRNSLECNEYQV